jgi:glycosyltransferase 2 family protein
MMNPKVKSSILNTLKIGLAAALITHLVRSGKIDFNQLKILLTGSNVVFCLGLVAVTLFLASERWRSILEAQNFHLSVWESLKLTLVGIFFNFAIPGGVGGDLVKGYYLTKSNEKRKFQAVLTIVLDRVIGLTAMSLMAAVALFYDFKFIWAHPELHILAWVLISLMVVFVFAWTAGFSSSLRHSRRLHSLFLKIPGHHRIFQLWDAILVFRGQKLQFIKAFAFSLIGQVASIWIFVQAGQIMGYQLPLHVYFVVAPIGFMITAIPISPAGIGVGQAAFLFLFNIFQGTENNLGSTAVTAFQACSLAWGLVGAVIYVLMKDARSSDTQTQPT